MKGDVHGRIGFARDAENVGQLDRAEGLSTMKDYAKGLYSSKAWQKTREAYKRKVGGLCEICWAKGIVKPGEIVHHKIHISPENINDPEIALNFDNLQLVCRDCHAQIHDRKKRRYKVDELGRVVFT